MPRRASEEERKERLENYLISQTNREFINMSPVNMNDLTAVQRRLEIIFNKFESNNMKPTLAGICAGLHVSKSLLGRICTDDNTGRCADIPFEVRECLRGVIMQLEANWESYMVEGKVNPATGIFIGKNQFGYRDVVEQRVERVEKQDTEYSIEDIRSRYLDSDSVAQIEETVGVGVAESEEVVEAEVSEVVVATPVSRRRRR